MFYYYVHRGLQSWRRSPILTGFMLITLAFGLAGFISTLAIVQGMARDPIPSKSAKLLTPLVDNVPRNAQAGEPLQPDDQLSYRDAVNLRNLHIARRAAALFDTATTVEPVRRDLHPMPVAGLAASRPVFEMFEIPFKYGQAWSEDEDARGANVVVVSEALARRLFGEANPVGEHLTMLGGVYQITGVMRQWRPAPRFYHTTTLHGGEEDYIFPFNTAIQQKIDSAGNMRCTGPVGEGYEGLLAAECTWVQLWFEIAQPGERGALQDAVNAYVREQQRFGRLDRNSTAPLFNVTEWLSHIKAVESDQVVTAWIALGFLILCILNTMGLLLASFSGRNAEIGVRRALGASRTAIFIQFLTESAVVGLAGGLLGVILAGGALALLSSTSATMAAVAHLNTPMLAFAFVLSVLSSMLAGLLPTWRASRIAPALQLKLQ